MAPKTPREKPSMTKHGEDLSRQGAYGRDGADLADSLVDRHDHHIHDTHKHDGNEHDLDEKGHNIDHPGNIVKRGETFPGVYLENRLALFVEFLEQGRL